MPMACAEVTVHRGLQPEHLQGIPLIDEESMLSCALTAVLHNLRQGKCRIVMRIFGRLKPITAFGTPAV